MKAPQKKSTFEWPFVTKPIVLHSIGGMVFLSCCHAYYSNHNGSRLDSNGIPDICHGLTDGVRGEKSVMWRNIKFLYMTDVEKSKIH